MPEDPLIQSLRKRYDELAREREPRTMTGGLVQPGEPTLIGEMWAEQDERYPVPESAMPRQMSRREAVSRALDEVMETRGFLEGFGQDIPPVTRQEPHWALKIPLAALTHLQRGQFAVVGGLEGILEKDPGQAWKNFYRGLIFAEPHETADLLDRYELLQQSPWLKLGAGIAGDIVLDPLTWVTFGASGAAKGALTAGFKASAKKIAKKGIPWSASKMDMWRMGRYFGDFEASLTRKALTAAEIRPNLSRWGRKVLDESMEVVDEPVAVNAILHEIASNTRVGKKLLPSGARFVMTVPRVGGQSVFDVGREFLAKRGLKFGYDVIPGGVLQHIDDINATQSLYDKFTRALIGAPIGKGITTFGQAFVPYWELRRKFPDLVDLDRAMKAKQHYMVGEIVRKVRGIIKTVDIEEDRKLLTELVEKPWLITGKKFATITRRGPKEVTVHFNQDYFPPGQRLSESHADQIVDAFYAIMHTVDDPQTVSRKLGRSSFGEVIGDFRNIAEPYIHQAIAAMPDTDIVNLRLGDWMVKIPKGFTTRPMLTRGAEIMSPTRFSDLYQNARAEQYIMDLMGGSSATADGRIVWRTIKDIYRGPADIEVPNRARIEEILSRPVFGGRSVAQFDEDTQWGILTGGWNRYSTLVRKEAQQFKSADEYAQGMLQRSLKFGNVPVPIVVKRFVRGQVADDILARLGARYQSALTAAADLPTMTNDYSDFIKKIFDITHQINRVGVQPQDFHAGNIIFHTTGEAEDLGRAVWIDYGYFTDWRRGVRVPWGERAGRLEPGRIAPVSGPALPRMRAMGERARGAPEEFWTPLPGLPGFETRHPKTRWKIKQAKGAPEQPLRPPIGGPATEAGREAARDLAIAQKTAALRSTQFLANHEGSPIKAAMDEFNNALSHPQVHRELEGLSVSAEDVREVVQRIQRISDEDAKTTVVEFLSDLKSKGIIKAYSLGDEPTWVPGLQAIVTSSYKIPRYTPDPFVTGPVASGAMRQALERGTIKYHVAWANDGTDALTPIWATEKEIHNRPWEEITEILVGKHPDLLTLPKKRQEAILKAHGVASEWMADLENQLIQRSLLDPGKVAAFKRKFGMQAIPEIKNIKTPNGLFRALHKAYKAQTSLGDLKYQDIPDAIRDLRKSFNKDLIEGDISKILLTHAIDTMAATDSFDLITEIAARWGKPAPLKMVKSLTTKGFGDETVAQVKEIAEHVADIPGYEVVNHPALKGTQIPEEIARYLKRYNRSMIGDGATKAIFAGYHRILGVWKGYATYVNPGFHGRNALSNIWQLYLKDGPEAMNLNRHRHAVAIMSGKVDGFIKTPYGKVSYKEVMDMARRYGIYGTGWFMHEIGGADDVAEAIMRKTGFWDRFLGIEAPWWTPHGAALKVGRRIGGAVENEARMVGFINDLMRTGNPAWAASNTKKYLFDYGELTFFERTYMKGIFPFYTWMRKNIALQAEQIIKQPAKYANIARFKSNLERMSPKVDERFLPKYFPELYAIRTPVKTGRGSPLYWNPNLPFQDLNRIFDVNDWVSSLAPWKLVAELGFNVQSFTGKPIAKYKGELSQVEWLDYISELNPTLGRTIATTLGAKQMYEPETGQWNWGLPVKLLYSIEQLNPFLRNIREVTGFTTGEVPYYRQEKRPYDFWSKAVGIKFIPYNPTKEVENYIFERRDQLRELRRSLVQQGKVPSPMVNIDELPPRM